MAENKATTEKEPEPKLEPGHHVFIGGKHNSGPYETEEAAQQFIDGHLDGKGEVREVEAEDE